MAIVTDMLLWSWISGMTVMNLPNFPKGINKVFWFWFWWILDSCILLFWISERQHWSKMTQDLLDKLPLIRFFVWFSNTLGFSVCVTNTVLLPEVMFLIAKKFSCPPLGWFVVALTMHRALYLILTILILPHIEFVTRHLKKQFCLYTSPVFGLWSEIECF